MAIRFSVGLASWGNFTDRVAHVPSWILGGGVLLFWCQCAEVQFCYFVWSNILVAGSAGMNHVAFPWLDFFWWPVNLVQNLFWQAPCPDSGFWLLTTLWEGVILLIMMLVFNMRINVVEELLKTWLAACNILGARRSIVLRGQSQCCIRQWW